MRHVTSALAATVLLSAVLAAEGRDQTASTPATPENTASFHGEWAISANGSYGPIAMTVTVNEWMTRIGDQGLINEAEMIQRMWPGGVQPVTAQPYVASRLATEPPTRISSMAVESPIEVVVYVPTQGASIGYTTDEGPSPVWRLYTGPIPVEAGTALRVKAIRYGYQESAETRVVFTAR